MCTFCPYAELMNESSSCHPCTDSTPVSPCSIRTCCFQIFLKNAIIPQLSLESDVMHQMTPDPCRSLQTILETNLHLLFTFKIPNSKWMCKSPYIIYHLSFITVPQLLMFKIVLCLYFLNLWQESFGDFFFITNNCELECIMISYSLSLY